MHVLYETRRQVMTVCQCPDSYPAWHNETVNLAGKSVFADPLFTPLHMPLNFDLQLGHQNHTLSALELKETWPGLVFMRTGLWRGELLRFLDNADAPARQIRRLAPPFNVYAVVHKGDVGTIAVTLKQIQQLLLQRGCMPKQWYLGYLTCPVCAEQKGGHKILVLRRFVENSRLKARLEGNIT